MNSETDRLSRAGNYVLGLMSEADRERAERDLEVDAAFREAVLGVAERMRILDFAPRSDAGDWKLIAARIGQMPHMRGVAATAGMAGRASAEAAMPLLQRLEAWPGRRALPIVVGLAIAFALGYAAGMSSPGHVGSTQASTNQSP